MNSYSHAAPRGARSGRLRFCVRATESSRLRTHPIGKSTTYPAGARAERLLSRSASLYMWLPSPASLVLVIRLVAFVALAYYLSLHRLPTLKGIFAAILLMIGMLGAYDGFTRAAREDSRSRYGRVVAGVVVEMYQSNGAGRTYTPSGREGPHAGTSGLLIYEGLARLLAYGSARTR